MVDLRAMLWASMHDYDADDEPVWPLTVSQVGRLLNFNNVVPLFVRFLTGVSANSPSKEELGEPRAVAKGAADTAESGGPGSPPISDTAGGAAGIELPPGALD